MKHSRVTKTLLILLLTIPVIAFSQESSRTLKRKIAIGRFSNETQYSKSVFYDKSNDPMGKQASDLLSSKLAISDKFILIERLDFDKIVSELNTSGVVSEGVGADYLIIGSITEFGRKNIGKEKFFSNSKKQIVEAAVSIRIVDVATGLTIYGEEAKGEAFAENKQVLGLGDVADFDATLSDKAISAAINQLVENIITKCMDKPWKAYLLSKEEGGYIISGGSSQGIRKGDVFSVIQKGKTVKNPQTGVNIELPGKEVATIIVDQTLGDTPQNEISLVSLSSGTIGEDFSNYYITEKK